MFEGDPVPLTMYEPLRIGYGCEKGVWVQGRTLYRSMDTEGSSVCFNSTNAS
ncbi:MAG: hypothetical protein Fur005_25950 [Roseiflexaceae bacterium]